MAKIKINIENIVASTSLGVKLDLEAINKKLENTEYTPSRFPALIYNVKKPKMVILLFDSGKVACTGARSTSDIESVINELYGKLEKLGVFK